MAEKIKLLLALAIIAVAMVVFYVFSDYSVLLRTGGLIVSVAVAVAIGLTTSTGKGVWEFVRGAIVEARKVVLPTRKETTQITLFVMAMVSVMGLVLWLFDYVLAWGVRLLTGQGG